MARPLKTSLLTTFVNNTSCFCSSAELIFTKQTLRL